MQKLILLYASMRSSQIPHNFLNNQLIEFSYVYLRFQAICLVNFDEPLPIRITMLIHPHFLDYWIKQVDHKKDAKYPPICLLPLEDVLRFHCFVSIHRPALNTIKNTHLHDLGFPCAILKSIQFKGF